MRDYIRTNPNKDLRKKASPIKNLNPLEFNRVLDMVQLMYKSQGIGLAAPQIGWSVRLFVISKALVPPKVLASHKNFKDGLIFINPKIQPHGDLIELDEGCLSIPGIVGAVDRPEKVIVEAEDLKGKSFKMELDHLAARCVLHEYDHLDGILFVDKAKKLYKADQSTI